MLLKVYLMGGPMTLKPNHPMTHPGIFQEAGQAVRQRMCLQRRRIEECVRRAVERQPRVGAGDDAGLEDAGIPATVCSCFSVMVLDVVPAEPTR